MFLQASRKHGLHSSQTNGLSPEWTRMLVSRCWAWENDFENFYQAMAFLQNLQISSIWIRIEKYFEHSLQHMSESQTGAGNLNLHALENTTFFTGICLQKMAFPQKGLLPRNSFSPKMTSPLKMVSPQKMAFSRNFFVWSRYISNYSELKNWKKIITTYISTNMSSSMLVLFWKKANFCSKSRIDKYLIPKCLLLPGERNETLSICVSLLIKWLKCARSTKYQA